MTKRKAERPVRKPRSGPRVPRKPTPATPVEIPQLRRPDESVEAWRARVQDLVKTGRLKLHKTTSALGVTSHWRSADRWDFEGRPGESYEEWVKRTSPLPLKTQTMGPKANPDDEVAAVIAARERPYGDYAEQCEIVDDMMHALLDSSNWRGMQPDQRESLHMIVVKISRIINGDADYKDSWRDIAGYAMLVANRLTE